MPRPAGKSDEVIDFTAHRGADAREVGRGRFDGEFAVGPLLRHVTFELRKQERGIFAKTGKMRPADGQTAFRFHRQPAGVIAHESPAGARAGVRQRTLSGAGRAAQQEAVTSVHHGGGMHRHRHALRQDGIGHDFQEVRPQAHMVSRGLPGDEAVARHRVRIVDSEIVAIVNNREQVALAAEARLAVGEFAFRLYD